MTQELKPQQYKVFFDIQPMADKLGISKDKCAELLADEILKILGLTKCLSKNDLTN